MSKQVALETHDQSDINENLQETIIEEYKKLNDKVETIIKKNKVKKERIKIKII